MLGAAKPDALRAEGSRLLRVLGSIRVRPYAERLILVRELHDASEVTAGRIRRHGGDRFAVNVSRGTVEGNDVPFFIYFAFEGELLVRFVHLDVAAAGNAAGAHAAGNDCRVGGHAAADGEDALRVVHTLDVFGGSFQSHKDDLFAFLALFHGVLRREYDTAAGGAGRSGQSGSDGLRRF